MNKTIKSKIINYAKNDSSGVEYVIVFGEALTDNSETAIVRLAVMFKDSSDIEDQFSDMLTVVDDITNGRFELLILNGDNLMSDAINEIEQGVVIYDSCGEKT